MRFGKKSVLVVIILMVFSTYLTLYTLKAHAVAGRIYEGPNGEVVSWRSGPSGSLFPWPRESGMLGVLSKVSEVDLLVYRYLVKTWVLIGLSMLMWIATGLSIFKLAKKQLGNHKSV
jgi:hypothetical protein